MTGVVPDGPEESLASLVVAGPSTPIRSSKIAPSLSSAQVPLPLPFSSLVERTPPPKQLDSSPPAKHTPAQKSAKVAPLGLVTSTPELLLSSVRVAHAAVPLRKGQWVARAEGADGLGSSTDDDLGPADSEDSDGEPPSASPASPSASSVRPPSAVLAKAEVRGPSLAKLMSPHTRAALGTGAFSLAVLDTDSDDDVLSSQDSQDSQDSF